MKYNWIYTTLGKHINFKNGKQPPDRDDIYPNPIFGSNGIIGYCNDYNAPKNTLIIGRVGSYCGSVFYSNVKCWVTDNAILGVPKISDESEFWYFVLSNLNLNDYKGGSGQPLLNQRILNSIKTKVPNSSEERKKIGKYLITFNKKSQLNRQINQTLEEIAQAVFKSWFMDFDPVKAKIAAKENGQDPECAAMCAISGRMEEKLKELAPNKLDLLYQTASLFPDELVESELGLIPKGWKLRSLSKIANYLNGVASQKYPAVSDEDSIPVIKIAEMRNGISKKTDMASTDVDPQYIINNGDLLFSWSGSLMVLLWSNNKGLLNQHIFKVTSEKYPKWFCYYWITHYLPYFQAIAAGKAVTMGHIKRNHLDEVYAVVPDKLLLSYMDRVLSAFLDTQLQYNLQNNTLIQIRDILLPQLLSGQISIARGEN